MTRLEAFEALKNHAWLHRSFAKLKPDELELARDFLARNETLSKGEFEHVLLRMFIDKPVKPKHWTQIEELLICANSSIVS